MLYLLDGNVSLSWEFVAVGEVDHQLDDFRLKVLNDELVFLRLQKLLRQQHRLQGVRLVSQDRLVAGKRLVAGDDLEVREVGACLEL